MLSSSSAENINANDMEWICVECATAGVLGKQYLREQRLDLAVKYCKKLDDCSIYADVCDKGMHKINAWVCSCECPYMRKRASKSTSYHVYGYSEIV